MALYHMSAFFFSTQQLLFCRELPLLKNKVSDPSLCHSQRSLGETHIARHAASHLKFEYSTIYSKDSKITAKHH